MRSADSACDCGCTEAIVRVRGNAFAATCIDCRRTAIVPMLAERELREAFGESAEIAQVVHLSVVRSSRVNSGDLVVPDHLQLQLGVEFRLPTP